MPSLPSVTVVPSGTVTFLLTDVEGSTPLWATDPARTGVGVARHYEILEAAISAHGGVRPVEQGEGDSVVGAFTRPSDAVAAAIEAQLVLLGELDWLPVRMAIHTGEAILRGEQNYVGPSIIGCARIRACAHGRQILVSDATAALVGNSVALVDLGAVRLKGITAPERVWQVTAPGLPGEFPALRGLDVAPHNLPTAITPLIGRRDELARVRSVVAVHRLTTVTGAGGCGKTRLALALGTEAIDGYAGGTWWVELATAATDEQVANAVATAIRLPLVAGTDPVAQVTNQLRQNGPTLLILDNAEHVIDAVAILVSAVVDTCAEVRVIVTSREPLGVNGEEVWRAPSLAADDAVALFLERAKSSRSDLVFDEAVVANICERLDGIPLAIELAAARARSLPLERIAAELVNVFRVLTGGARTAVARQQTLLASITWSYDLLNPIEQAVLRRLSVFQSPFQLDTAERIAADGDLVVDLDVLDVVARLVDKSLVQFDPLTARYRLLETVRQFGAERLGQHDETDAVRNRHAVFYGRYAQQIGGRMRGLVVPDDVWLDLPDVFAALRWAYQASPLDADRICGMNRMARTAIGYHDELAEQVDWLLARDGTDAPALWATAVTHLRQEGLTILGRFDRVAELPDVAGSIDPTDSRTRFWQAYATGFAALATGDTSELHDAVDLASREGDTTAILAATAVLAQVSVFTGRLGVTNAALTRMKATLRSLDQPLTCDTSGQGHCAAIYHALWSGRIAEAREYIQTQLPRNGFMAFLSGLAIAWTGFVTDDREIGYIAQRWTNRPAPSIVRGVPSFVALLTAKDGTEKSVGGHDRADDLTRARGWFEQLRHTMPTVCSALAVPLAAAYLAEADTQTALTIAEDLYATAHTMGHPPSPIASYHQIIAMAAYAAGDNPQVAASARELISLAVAQGYVLMQIDGLELLALSATSTADTTARLLAATEAACDQIGYRGRWPNLASPVLAATAAARNDQPAAFESGKSTTLAAMCAAVLDQDTCGC